MGGGVLINWINEIKAFERWLDANYLPDKAQLLWYKLMYINNGCMWEEWFVVDNLRLMSLIKVSSKDTLVNLRSKLIESGLIEYRKGKKGSPGKYHMVAFGSKNQTENEAEYRTDNQSENWPINQPHNKRIQENRNKNSFSGGGETSALGERVSTDFPERVENQGLSAYLGMTAELASCVERETGRLVAQYFGRTATGQDAERLFDRVRLSRRREDGTWEASIDSDKLEVMEYAFRAASQAGVYRWDYIDGVLARCRQRGLTTVEACESYDAQREIDQGGIR